MSYYSRLTTAIGIYSPAFKFRKYYGSFLFHLHVYQSLPSAFSTYILLLCCITTFQNLLMLVFIFSYLRLFYQFQCIPIYIFMHQRIFNVFSSLHLAISNNCFQFSTFTFCFKFIVFSYFHLLTYILLISMFLLQYIYTFFDFFSLHLLFPIFPLFFVVFTFFLMVYFLLCIYSFFFNFYWSVLPLSKTFTVLIILFISICKMIISHNH